MSQEDDNRDHLPPRLSKYAYKLFAAGRYASDWLPELLDLYDRIVQEEGKHEAYHWLLQELGHASILSLVVRAYRLSRVVNLVWKKYRKVARK